MLPGDEDARVLVLIAEQLLLQPGDVIGVELNADRQSDTYRGGHNGRQRSQRTAGLILFGPGGKDKIRFAIAVQ
ncbi:hypothetical protein D3C86_1882660 [compost metagenome]